MTSVAGLQRGETDLSGSAQSDWSERMENAAGTPLGELVEGLGDVAALAIPYARLPRRARTACGQDFAVWGDIAGQSVASLLCRPKIGKGAVRAMLEAAEDAVAGYRAAVEAGRVGAPAAVRRLVDRVDGRDHALLARLWAGQDESQRALATRLGVNIASIYRNQPRAQARFAELVAEPIHQEVRECARSLARRLGPYTTAAAVDTELNRVGVDVAGESALVLLYLAGPYVRRGQWFENATTSGQRQAAAAVDAVFGRCPAPRHEALVRALIALGMSSDVADVYLRNQVALRSFGDVWVRWGETPADRAEAVLHGRGTSTTLEDLIAAIGPDSVGYRAFRDTLNADDRFVRTSRLCWGLRGWGVDEYTGVFHEIAAGIDAGGGKADIDKLVRSILSRFPDVAENSIRANLSALAFVCEGGVVRRRAASDGWPPVPALNAARGAFRNGDKEVRLAVPVTSDVLRGSGLQLRPAVAVALGLSPGQQRLLSSPYGQVVVAWRLSSTNGPSIGSLRVLATACGATRRDTLVVVFRLDESSLDAQRVGAELTGIERLRRLLGRPVRSPAAALAAGLGCRRDEVATVLRRRGDHDIADLVED
jgi:hypothetical protein